MIQIHLAKLLGERHWTQSYLAQRTGIRPNTICELYHGYAERISLIQIDSICNVLQCDLKDLLEYTTDKSDGKK